ncbi:MAG: AAA family ATPase [Ruminococcus flavefaciens]|nr:AAA family ATPase [Ruminococcus flavefaciens]
MGKYVNPKNTVFNTAGNARDYVDKTGLIEFTNERINDFRPLICVSRPRRFGKTMAAQMLASYYSKGCDSKELFSKFKIASSDSFERELNRSNVIYLDIRMFCGYCSRQGNFEQVVKYIQREVIGELRQIYPEIVSDDVSDLPKVLYDIYAATNEKFIVIIDEWDCLFREDKDNTKLQDEYIDFLRGMFKDGFAEAFIKLAYITGILPIKKYGTQSALNNFREYTMVEPMNLAEYVGFTETEVRELCNRYNMSFDERKQWYDGYSFDDVHSVYSPNSVMTAMQNHKFGSYWTSTETYESLRFYIDTDFDDVRTKILAMLAGEVVEINPRTFQNDMKNMKNSDDVLTLLIHLEYLAYNSQECFAYIPNKEVREEFVTATRNSGREELAKIIRNSDELIKATLKMNGDEVAGRIQEVHQHG